MAPRGVEVAMSYKEVDIITTNKTQKKNSSRKQYIES